MRTSDITYCETGCWDLKIGIDASKLNGINFHKIIARKNILVSDLERKDLTSTFIWEEIYTHV